VAGFIRYLGGLVPGRPLCRAGPVPAPRAAQPAQARQCARAGLARAWLQAGRTVLVPGRYSAGPRGLGFRDHLIKDHLIRYIIIL
jgi:hypothetical protein